MIPGMDDRRHRYSPCATARAYGVPSRTCPGSALSSRAQAVLSPAGSSVSRMQSGPQDDLDGRIAEGIAVDRLRPRHLGLSALVGLVALFGADLGGSSREPHSA